VQVLGQTVIGVDFVLHGIIGNFLGVHSGSRHLDTSPIVHIGVAQVVGELLNVLLGGLGVIVHYIVVNRSGSGNGGFVRNQVEVKLFLSLVHHQSRVHAGPWSWVDALSVVLLEQSQNRVLVHQGVHH
jgi:hypothetical protein